MWHRLNIEAAIPAHCGCTVWLAATNVARPPDEADASAWHPHAFGNDIAALDEAATAPHVPRAVWDRAPSELPGHNGLLGGAQVPGVRGLFGVLVQGQPAACAAARRPLSVGACGDVRRRPRPAPRSRRCAPGPAASRMSISTAAAVSRKHLRRTGGVARRAVGAHRDRAPAAELDAGGQLSDTLRARLLLEGVRPGAAARISVEQPGQSWRLTDATRAWRLRRETDIEGSTEVPHVVIYTPQATPADFTARLMANFEGVLTNIEDRVAAAHLLTSRRPCPKPASTGWPAGSASPSTPHCRPTAAATGCGAAPDLARRHGTRDGLRLALDVASGGGVRGGEIVVIEDFRLRRILATLLGVDLSDANDPLLPGLHISGNSIVGDTLFVGSNEGSELAALFSDAATTDAEDDAALAFLGKLAFRATVLVHQQVQAQDLALLRRIEQLEAPAHVQVRVVSATWPLLVGVASLVGVDTYLGPPRLPRQVQVQRSAVGMGDRLIGAGVLDPRLAGNTDSVQTLPPTADAGPDMTQPFGRSFDLDGSGSRAAPGKHLTEYRWRLLPPTAE